MRYPILGILGLAFGAACGDEVIGPPAGTDTTLVILPRAVLLTVGDSLQLRGVVTTPAGDTLDALVGFVTRDPTVVSISLDGLVRGVGLGTTWVVANGASRLDSVFVTVATNVDVPGLRLLTNQLSNPVFVTQPPGDSVRLFVVQQRGLVRILRNDALQSRPFLDLTAIVTPTLGEQGLFSLAFHPDYQQNGYFYVSYTDRQGDSRIVRYQVSATDPDSADPGTDALILGVDQPYGNHNGGLILFGPDGMLYVGLGDGGSGGDPENRAQTLDSLLGKHLRLDVDAGLPYGIPADNPFVGTAGARPEIWALGLRNPWRFSFDRATGDLYTADVGQNRFEEVSVAPGGSPGGENYGWRLMEGLDCFDPSDCSPAGLTLPVLVYPHSDGCSVSGGYVYRGSALPILAGRYLYSDYCAGWVRSFTYYNGSAVDRIDWSAELSPGQLVTSFGEDNAGELYIMTASGSLYRIVPQVANPATK